MVQILCSASVVNAEEKKPHTLAKKWPKRRKHIRRSAIRRKIGRRDWLDPSFHTVSQTVSLAADVHHMRMVQQSVQKSRGQDVVAEKLPASS